MSVRIERIDKDGTKWCVSGGSLTELETGILAVDSALKKREQQPRKGRGGRPTKGETTQATEKQSARAQQALSLLRVMQDAKAGGADSEAIGAVAKIRDGKGLGPIMGRLARVIKEIGFPPDTVFTVTGFSPHKRWVPQSNIGPAIKRLEEMS